MTLETFRPLIERALAHTGGVSTWAELSSEVEQGRAYLLPSLSGRSVAVLQPMRDLHVFAAAGDMDELMAMEAETAERARLAGYDRMTLIGRDGWRRVLAARGWKPETGLVRAL